MLQQFTFQSALHVMIATNAFRIGIDCPDVRQVIKWDVPEDAQMYVLESKSAEKPAIALLLKNAHDVC